MRVPAQRKGSRCNADIPGRRPGNVLAIVQKQLFCSVWLLQKKQPSADLRYRELSTSVGVTASKELCKCVTSTGILSKGRA